MPRPVCPRCGANFIFRRRYDKELARQVTGMLPTCPCDEAEVLVLHSVNKYQLLHDLIMVVPLHRTWFVI